MQFYISSLVRVGRPPYIGQLSMVMWKQRNTLLTMELMPTSKITMG